jgi:hypothetical protein
LIEEWTAQEHIAMEQRGDYLKIYEVKAEKRGQFIFGWGMSHSCVSVQTLAEICLKLSETEVRQGNLSGVVSALTEGLAIEKSQ